MRVTLSRVSFCCRLRIKFSESLFKISSALSWGRNDVLYVNDISCPITSNHSFPLQFVHIKLEKDCNNGELAGNLVSTFRHFRANKQLVGSFYSRINYKIPVLLGQMLLLEIFQYCPPEIV